MATARSIYAYRATGVDPKSNDAVSIMEEAVQIALGQTKVGRTTFGGVQEVGAGMVLLPPTMNGERVGRGLRAAFGSNREMRSPDGTTTEQRPPQWDRTGGPLFYNGAEIDMHTVDRIKLVPLPSKDGLTAGRYTMEIRERNGGTSMVARDDGRIAVIDLGNITRGVP